MTDQQTLAWHMELGLRSEPLITEAAVDLFLKRLCVRSSPHKNDRSRLAVAVDLGGQQKVFAEGEKANNE